jgi:hypothetical protein
MVSRHHRRHRQEIRLAGHHHVYLLMEELFLP